MCITWFIHFKCQNHASRGYHGNHALKALYDSYVSLCAHASKAEHGKFMPQMINHTLNIELCFT